MSDDLVSRLREQASSDHVRGCQGRQYSCDCGYDIRGEWLLEQAATALTEARAEIETKTQAIADMARQMYEMQSELSTLRARVREVLGGMLAHSCVADAGPDCKDGEDEAAERAARQLIEDLK